MFRCKMIHSTRWTTHRYTFPYLWINRGIIILALCQGVAKGKGEYSGWFPLIFDTLILGMSCKNSETEDMLSVVPISAGIGIFITSDSTMLVPELSFKWVLETDNHRGLILRQASATLHVHWTNQVNDTNFMHHCNCCNWTDGSLALCLTWLHYFYYINCCIVGTGNYTLSRKKLGWSAREKLKQRHWVNCVYCTTEITISRPGSDSSSSAIPPFCQALSWHFLVSSYLSGSVCVWSMLLSPSLSHSRTFSLFLSFSLLL